MCIEEVSLTVGSEELTGKHDLRREYLAPENVQYGTDDGRVDQVELDPEPLLELILLLVHT